MKMFKKFLVVVFILFFLQLAWMEYLRSVFPARYDVSTAHVTMGAQKYTVYIKREKGKSDPITIAFYLNNTGPWTGDRVFSLYNYQQGRFMCVDATGVHGINHLPKPIELAYRFRLDNFQETQSWFYSHYSYLGVD